MSGAGSPNAYTVAANGLRLGIVASRWNAEVVDALLDRSLAAAGACGVSSPVIVRVAGATELPVMAQALARRCDAVVALGAIIRGETPHFDYVSTIATGGLARVALDERTPVGNGVLTCETQEQAIARSGGSDATEDAGWQATVAALESALELRRLARPLGQRHQ